MVHTFGGPFYMKNEKDMKKSDRNHIFHVFLILFVEGSTKISGWKDMP